MDSRDDQPSDASGALIEKVSPRSSGGLTIVEYVAPRMALSSSELSVIRRHAMKEIGKSRRRPKPSKEIQLDLSALQDDQARSRLPPWWLGSLWRQVHGYLDPFVRYPIEVDSVARGFIANGEWSLRFIQFILETHVIVVFQDPDSQQRPLRDAWFTVGLEDEAAFLQVLANSALYLDSMRNNGRIAKETSDSMRYHARALVSVQERMKMGDGAVSDGLIGAVTGFMCHAVCLII
jgi:hypothetical protein